MLAISELVEHDVGQRVEPRRRDVDDAWVDNRGREAVLERKRSGDPVPGLADADHGDPGGVDVGALQNRVQDGREHGLPVGSEGDCLLVKRRLPAGAVEGQPVIAAFTGCRPAVHPRLRGRAVTAVVDDDQRPALLGARVGGREEIRGQGRVLVGDADAFSADRHPIDSSLPAFPLATPDIEFPLGFELLGVRDAVQRRGVVGRGAAVVGQRTGRPSCRIRFLAGYPCRAGGGGPFCDPGVRVSVGDPAGGREHLAHVGSLAVAAAQRFLQAELKVVILEEDDHS